MRGKSWITWVLGAIVILAIWKMNNGDPSKIIDSVWAMFNKGADIVTGIWEKIMSMKTPSPSPSPTATATVLNFLNFLHF